MNKKLNKTLFRLIAVFAVVLTAMIVSNGIRVHADNGETVRVSTAKELKAAIKNADVGTIIIRTEAYIDITIKADKAAKSKSLIVDAKNADITNKAVFADINILSANSYTESAKGNSISLSDAYIPDGFTVAKKKKVKSLIVYDSYASFYSCYTLRKGAKISNLELVYSGGDEPVKSSYNKSKKQVTISCNSDGCERSYTIKLDKSGRMISIKCKSNWPEADYEEAFKYDSNGNVVKNTGVENMSGEYSAEMTYAGNLIQKSVYKSSYSSSVYTYEYDKKGNLTHYEYHNEDSMDGQTFVHASVADMEYDKKGRLTYEMWENIDSGYFHETSSIYDSNGFITEMTINSSGSISVYQNKYNKAGDLIQTKYTCEGFEEVTTYEYDELGVLITTSVE